MTEVLMNWLVPFVCGGVIAWLSTAVKKLTNREQAEREGIQCLLRAEIIRQHEKYQKLGYCPIYAKEALKKEYTAYHELGGNDVASRLFEEVMKLPVEKGGRGND